LDQHLTQVNADSPLEATEQALSDLRADGFAPSNIAVLSLHGLGSSKLAGSSSPDQLGGSKVRRQSGYDSEGTAVWTDGDLLVDSVFRFKGQAADAVVVTEVDFEQFTQRERRRLFVALTRARLQVALVTTERAAEVLRARLDE
jgi:superfamily I DNA and RNA helicase